MIVCLAANPSIDKLFEVEKLEPGSIHRPTVLTQVPGGKGLNVARAAAALGADVTAVALLRGHAGKWIEEALATEGVPGRFVWAHGENRSALSVADRETRRLTEFYERGSEVPASAWVELAHAVEQALAGASWLTMSGSLPVGIPVHGYGELIGSAHGAGVRTAIDSHGEALGSALIAGPEFVKVNASEAAESLGGPVEAAEAAREFRRGAGGDGHGAVVTEGGAGAVLAAPDGSVWRGELDATGPYPVGSGDAFLAGFVVSMERGAEWADAFVLALGAAAANAELPGAGRLERSRAESLAERARLTRV